MNHLKWNNSSKKYSVHKTYLAAAAIFGGLGVALGAFGAHGLQRITADESILNSYDTAARYQLIHAVALLGIAAIAERNQDRILRWAANCFIIGIILFSGSLYLLTYFKIQESDAVKILGPVTPVGGLFMIAGWVFLLILALKRRE